MCATCGCAPAPQPDPGHEHPHASDHGHDDQHRHDHGHGDQHRHDHGHGDQHRHDHEHDRGHTISLEQRVLAKNDELAAANRRRLIEGGVRALNVMSSPGAGKTTLLERTLSDLTGTVTISVIEGDQETPLDAERITAAGAKVVQINTGQGCHLDAAMVRRGLRELDPPDGSVVFIENVGNLVCPALFDLGEAAKVVIASVTEGEDKPVKYPHMFAAADLVLLNKIDLLPYLRFDVDRWRRGVRRVNPTAAVLPVSAIAGEGMPDWYAWLRATRPADPDGHRPPGRAS